MDREESTLVEATDSPLYGTRLRKNVLRERRSEVMASQLELMATLYSLETVVRMVKLGLAEYELSGWVSSRVVMTVLWRSQFDPMHPINKMMIAKFGGLALRPIPYNDMKLIVEHAFALRDNYPGNAAFWPSTVDEFCDSHWFREAVNPLVYSDSGPAFPEYFEYGSDALTPDMRYDVLLEILREERQNRPSIPIVSVASVFRGYHVYPPISPIDLVERYHY
jgi:hypothetical protein